MKTEKISFEPKEVDIEIGKTSSIRIRGHRHNFIIETKDGSDSEWKELPYVSSILIDMNAEDSTALVIIERHIF